MRIVIVKPILPYPPDQGTKALTLGLIESLADAHDVTLCTRLLDAEDARWVPEVERRGARVRAVLAPNRRSAAHRIAYRAAYAVQSALTGVSRDGFHGACGALRRAISEETRRAPADLAVIEYWYMAPLLSAVHARRTALLAPDVDWSVDALRHRHGTTGGGPWGRWRAARRRRREIESFRLFDVILALTEADKRRIEEAVGSGVRVQVLPYVAPAPDPRLDATGGASPPDVMPEHSVLLFGSMHADFNRDGAAWLVRDVLPRVRAVVPDARLLVGGSGDMSSIAELARNAPVDIVGRLASPAEWMRRAGVVAVPLRVGGGVHVRVIEAMRAGAAIVTTPVGVTGLPVQEGRDVLVAETADAFADAIVRVLRDPAERERLAGAARGCAESALDPAALRARAQALIAAVGDAR